MGKEMLPPSDYTNSIILDLVKGFWDERGGGAVYRTSTVGWSYIQPQVEALGKGVNMEDALAAAEAVLVKENILSSIWHRIVQQAVVEDPHTYRQIEIIEIEVEGCVHLPMERKLMETGTRVYLCPVSNMLACSVEKSQGVTTQQAAIDVQDGHCKVLLVIFTP